MSLETVSARIRNCKRCSLHQTRTKAVPGEGNPNAEVMLVGEAPGRREDETGRPFVGRAGKLLEQLLESIGLSREDVYITSVLKCRPPKNRNPRAGEIQECREYLEKQISAIDPKVICSLGGVATRLLLDKGSMKKAHGNIIRCEGRVYLPMYHPAAVFYGKKKETLKKDFQTLKKVLDWL